MAEVLIRQYPKDAKYPYKLSEQTHSKLVRKVDVLLDPRDHRSNQNFLTPQEIKEGLDTLDIKQLLKDRPEGMSEEDMIGVLKLAALTETATDLYKNAFDTAGSKYGQEEWKNRFTDLYWVPDEYMHDGPFVGALLKADAVSEEGFLAEVKQAKEAKFDYGQDHTPVMTDVFGIVQEDLTDHYHGLIANIAIKSKSNRIFGGTVFHTKKRETFHRVIYEDFAEIQIIDLLEQGNPTLEDQIADTLANFKLPGNANAAIRPYQEQAARYLQLMGVDRSELTSQVIEHVTAPFRNELVLAGGVALNIAARRNVGIVPGVPTSVVREVVNHIPFGGADRVNRIVGRGLIRSAKRRLEEKGVEAPRGAERIERWMEQKIAYKIRNSDIFGGQAA